MLFFFLLLPFLHVTARITLFDEQQSIASAPTFEFFEHRSNAYNVSGIAYQISLNRDPKTQLCKVVAPPTFDSNSFAQSFQQTILFAVFDEAQKCGIYTISQLFEKAHEMLPLLAEAGYPPSKTLVIFLGALYDGVAGCPIREPYMSGELSVSDTPPPNNVNVALVSGKHAKQILEAYDDDRPYAFNVVQETDPWNALFLSLGYVSFSWSIIAIYIVSIVAALKTSVEAYAKGAATGNLWNAVFWMAILSSLSNFTSINF